ncbi:glutamate--tRNA ligase [Candidatus Latescibacterota bacterium]
MDITPRVRFAPSPTGDLHVGGARTALFNWLYARKTGGKFLLRIEDTDTKRSSEEALASILESLRWLGLDWDEEPVYQSKRGDIYREAVRRLLEIGAAYRCFCTEEELERERDRARAEKLRYHYSGKCRSLDPKMVERYRAEGRPAAVRFRVPEGETSFDDMIHGATTFQNETIGDFIIARKDSSPMYLLGVAVDDADMGITLVMRGDDHLSNTPKQIMIMRALGCETPRFAHLPQVLGPDLKKLSKRHGAVSVIEYRRKGFLPDALVNFLALLGWNPGDDREKMSREELIAAFSLDQASKKSGVFNIQKLEWLNSLYLAEQPAEALLGLAGLFLVEQGLVTEEELRSQHDYLLAVIELVKSRCKLVTDIPGMIDYFFAAPATYEDAGMRKYFSHESAADILEGLAARFESLDEFTIESAEETTRAFAGERMVGAGKLIHPTRLAVTGRTYGPGLFDIIAVIGRERVVSRMRRAAAFIRKRKNV